MTEDKILWTAQYVEGDLNEAERLEFENLLTHDEELKQYLADYYDIHSSLHMELTNDSERGALLETLQALNKEHFAVEQPKVVKLSTYLRWVSVWLRYWY
jgi:anti-sigma factor RsiW